MCQDGIWRELGNRQSTYPLSSWPDTMKELKGVHGSDMVGGTSGEVREGIPVTKKNYHRSNNNKKSKKKKENKKNTTHTPPTYPASPVHVTLSLFLVASHMLPPFSSLSQTSPFLQEYLEVLERWPFLKSKKKRLGPGRSGHML